MFEVKDKVIIERRQEGKSNWDEAGRGIVMGILVDPSTREQVSIKYRDKEWIREKLNHQEVIMIDAARFRVRRFHW